jgi:hypothetical protein
LIRELSDELGGLASLPASVQATVKRLAQLCVEAELFEAARAQGEAIDPVAYASIVNAARRVQRDFEALKREREAKKVPSLTSYLASKAAASTASEASA